MADLTYQGVLFPLVLTTSGDYAKGNRSQVVRSHIMAVLQTSRFRTLDSGGERLMRPGAYGLVPALLFEPFIPEVQVPAVDMWVREALSHLVADGSIRLLDLAVRQEYDPNRLHIRLEYKVQDVDETQVFETEIRTMTPVVDTQVRG